MPKEKPQKPEWSMRDYGVRRDESGVLHATGAWNAIVVGAVLPSGAEVFAWVGEVDGRYRVGKLEIGGSKGRDILTDDLRAISLSAAIRAAQDEQGDALSRGVSHFDKRKTVRLTTGGGFEKHAEIAWLHYSRAWDNPGSKPPHVWLADYLTEKRRRFTTPAEVAQLVYQARHRYGLLKDTAQGGRQRPEPTDKLLDWAQEHGYYEPPKKMKGK